MGRQYRPAGTPGFPAATGAAGRGWPTVRRHRIDGPDGRTAPPARRFWQAVRMSQLYLAQEPAADEMLAADPFALLLGMLLDQQIPLEKAFIGPYRLAERLAVTRLDPAAIADHDADDLARIFATPIAIHRFPGSMAERSRKLARAVVDDYDGDAAAIWTGAADGADLLRRLGALPGFGKQKAQIFTALLGKQFGVRPAGWREAAGVYGEEGSLRSVADIVDAASLVKVREYKKQMKAAAKASGPAR
ncbi:HhH-GPD-type base excision DNA repair protein [Polymorphospora sp. NPDC051019]|uniref:HhH-GPD-type base excision DNA repair protein n=1 Tax=Polymorphospora sp. NPDC051019 TaxID=3155725 RepID=UPI00343EEE36